jgi:hypothetical protein
MNDEEDLMEIITRQRLTIYHQQMRIEGYQRQLLQATQMNPNDIIEQAFNQLQMHNSLTAAKARLEAVEQENAKLKKRGDELARILEDINDVFVSKQDAISAAVIRNAISKWKE